MEFSEGPRSKYVHVKNDSAIPYEFRWDSRVHRMEAGEVAFVPEYLAEHICHSAPKRPEHILRVIDEATGSLEYLQSEAKRKQAEAQLRADEAKKAMDAAEAARTAAARAAGDVKSAVDAKAKK